MHVCRRTCDCLPTDVWEFQEKSLSVYRWLSNWAHADMSLFITFVRTCCRTWPFTNQMSNNCIQTVTYGCWQSESEILCKLTSEKRRGKLRTNYDRSRFIEMITQHDVFRVRSRDCLMRDRNHLPLMFQATLSSILELNWLAQTFNRTIQTRKSKYCVHNIQIHKQIQEPYERAIN